MAAIPAPTGDTSGHTDGAGAVTSRSPRAEIVAITGDDHLLEQIGQLLDGESIVRHADSPAEARRLLRPSQPCVLLLDARGHDDLGRTVQELQTAEGTGVLVIFAPTDLSAEIARTVRGSAAFAVLSIPVEQAQATAVIEGACEESLARHALLSAAPPPRPLTASEHSNVLTATAQPVVPPRFHAPKTAPMTGRPKILAAAAACFAILVGAVVWSWLHAPTRVPKIESAPQPKAIEPAAAVPEAVLPPEALQAGSVEDLLDSARAAMRERRYTDPEGNNALNYYKSALAQEPANGEAREGLQRVAAVLQERVASALEGHRYEEATRTLAQLRSVRPDDPAYNVFDAAIADARIRKALDEGDVARAGDLLKQAARTGAVTPQSQARWQTELDRQQSTARAEKLAQLVSLRIRQGQLLDPAGDSAKYHLGQLRRLPPEPRRLAELATTELQQAYLNKLRDAMVKSQRVEIDRWKTEARALGVSAAELSAVQRDVAARSVVAESKQEAAKTAQLVQERIADGRLLEPAGDSAMFHLNALRGLDGSASAVSASERALSAKLLEQGRSALSEQRTDVARTHAAASRGLGVNLDAVAALERDIAAAGSAKPPAESAQQYRLKRTRYVAPEYPKAALKQKLNGNVRLRLAVNAEGRVSEAAVVQSTPPGVFDEAAVVAARKWRFEPIGKKDSGAEAVINVDIVFKPEGATR